MAKHCECMPSLGSVTQLCIYDKGFLVGEVLFSAFEYIPSRNNYILYSDVKVLASRKPDILPDTTIRLYWAMIYVRRFDDTLGANAIRWRDTLATKGSIWRFHISDSDDFFTFKDKEVYYTNFHCDSYTKKYDNWAQIQNESAIFNSFRLYQSGEGFKHVEYNTQRGEKIMGNFSDQYPVGIWYAQSGDTLLYIYLFDSLGRNRIWRFGYFNTEWNHYFVWKGENLNAQKPMLITQTGNTYILSNEEDGRSEWLALTFKPNKSIIKAEYCIIAYKDKTKQEITHYQHITCQEKLIPTIFTASSK